MGENYNEFCFLQAIIRRGADLGGMYDDRIAEPAEEIRGVGLLLSHPARAEGGRKGRHGEGNCE